MGMAEEKPRGSKGRGSRGKGTRQVNVSYESNRNRIIGLTNTNRGEIGEGGSYGFITMDRRFCWRETGEIIPINCRRIMNVSFEVMFTTRASKWGG
jgi:hypothetical protein